MQANSSTKGKTQLFFGLEEAAKIPKTWRKNSTLRQLANRLSSVYHDGNTRHISSEVLERMTDATSADPFRQLTHREYATMASGTGSLTYAIIPLLLALTGTQWRTGVLR